MSKRIDISKGNNNTNASQPLSPQPSQNFYVPQRRYSAPPNKSAAQGFLVLFGLLALGAIWVFNFLKDNPAVLVALIASVVAILILLSVSKKRKKSLEQENTEHNPESGNPNDSKKL